MADNAVTKREEKRRHHRPMAQLDLKILRRAGGVDLSNVKLTTIDVAAGGMRCASNVRLDPGTILRIALDLAGGNLRHPATVVGDGCVLRCTERPDEREVRRYEIALEFVHISRQDKKRLESYLNSL